MDALAEAQAAHLSLLAGHPRVVNPRRLGTIAALDVAAPDSGYLSALAPRLIAFFRDRGVLLRPLGNSIYVMPPYCITPHELAAVWAAIAAALDSLCGPPVRPRFISFPPRRLRGRFEGLTSKR